MCNRICTRRLTALLLALLLLLPALSLAADTTDKRLLNSRCTLSWKGFCNFPERLSDNTAKTGAKLKAGASASVSWGEDVPVSLIYWEFTIVPQTFTFSFFDAAGTPLEEQTRYKDGVCGYLYVPEGARSVCFTSGDDGFMAEWHMYNKNDMPENILLWDPTPEKIDIMLVVTHADDELVMMGGIVPTYAAERGLKVLVVYCYVPYTEGYRYNEALGGLRFSGVYDQPVFLPLSDFELNHNKYRFAEKLTEQIRHHKPEVLITHDIKGEYGNPGHKLVNKNTQQAVLAAPDEKQYPESAATYGTWEVKKFYIHLYGENEIVMDFDTPLASCGGKTAFEMAQEAYSFHKSQRSDWLQQLRSNKYDCRKYGLFSTTVGPDVEKNDFLENIPAELLTNYVAPTPTPEPTATPTPTPTPEPTATPVPTEAPTAVPTAEPTATPVPTEAPTAVPTAEPTAAPTATPVPVAEGPSVLDTVLLSLTAILAVLGITVSVLVLKRARRRRR